MDICVFLCQFCSFLRLHLFFKGENYCLKYLIRKPFYDYFHNFLSPWTSINQVIPVRDSKILAFITFFITWFCTADSVRKSEGEKDKNQKVGITFSEKKWWNLASRTKQVMPNLTTSQFRSMLPYSVTETPSFLHHLSNSMVCGEGGFTSQKDDTFTQVPILETLRTRTEN